MMKNCLLRFRLIFIVVATVLAFQVSYAGPNKMCTAALASVKRAIKIPFAQKIQAKKKMRQVSGVGKYSAMKRVDNTFSGGFDINFKRSKKGNITKASYSKNPTDYQHGWAGYLVPVALVDILEEAIKSPEKALKVYTSKYVSSQVSHALNLYESEKKQILLTHIENNPQLKEAILNKAYYSNIDTVIHLSGYQSFLEIVKEEGVDLESLYKEKSRLRIKLKNYRNRESNIITVNGVKYYPAGPYSQGSEVPVVRAKESDWSHGRLESVVKIEETLKFLDQDMISPDIDAGEYNNDSLMRKFKLNTQVGIASGDQFIIGRFRGFWTESDERSRGYVFDSTGMREAVNSLKYDFSDSEILYQHNHIEYGSTVVFIEKTNIENGTSVVIPVTIEHEMALNLISEL